jgi:hypothetical protein
MKLKKNIYIFSYIICIIFICTLNNLSISDVLNSRLNLPLTSNPIYFFIIDALILTVIMRKLKKENYLIQKRVIEYFMTINNLFLFIALMFAGSFLTSLVNMVINIFLVYILRPMISDPSVNSVEEYFNKYNRDLHKFYNNTEEVKEEYATLGKEVITEMTALDVEIKNENKNKKRKIIYMLLPIIVITLFIVGGIFSVVEMVKTFERGMYHYYELTLNDENIYIEYEQNFHKVIIPIIYVQEESKYFDSTETVGDYSNIIFAQEKYILNLKEYECINNDKGNNVKVSCGHDALSETKNEVRLINTKMNIAYQNKIIYEGDFIPDVTKYIKEPGKYIFNIKNTRKEITTNITFVINIK